MGVLKERCGRHALAAIWMVLAVGAGSVGFAQGSFAAEPPVWSQPPVEKDPRSQPPVSCGWGEPAFATRPLPYAAAAWTFVADDFRCPGDMPVVSVRWWGSCRAWEGESAPRRKPQSWRLGFWSNAPADQRYPFRRPDTLLWAVQVPAARVEEAEAGTEESRQEPSDILFEYLLHLQPREYFRPERFNACDTKDRIFWISITAVYTGAPEPANPWVWQSRPEPWASGAVRAQFQRAELRAGFSLEPSLVRSVAGPSAFERQDAYDMAFELGTTPAFVLWEQPFTGIRPWANYSAAPLRVGPAAPLRVGPAAPLRVGPAAPLRVGEDQESLAVESPNALAKWTQPPDRTAAGGAVDLTRDSPTTWPATLCADDFECRTTGAITGIALWASWYRDTLPSGSADQVTFTLSIRQNIPAGRSTTGYGMPGKVLWRREFSRGQFTIEPVEGPAEGYYSPANETFVPDDHVMAYKYTFNIDPSEAFQQTGTEENPAVYWLTVQARVVHAPGSVATRLGWQTSASRGNSGAVWVKAEAPYGDSAWRASEYPKGHALGGRPVDLAFTIETHRPNTGVVLRRMVADDWSSPGDLPVTGMAWWGSYLGRDTVAPQSPDAFLLSIWANASTSDPTRSDAAQQKGAEDFSRPGKKLWEYRAERFDEVLVGYDTDTSPTSMMAPGFKPVYRYAVCLPQEKWFRPEGRDRIYWLSVVAVYKGGRVGSYPTPDTRVEGADALVEKPPCSWAWTNHPGAAWGRQTLTPSAHCQCDETAGEVAADREAFPARTDDVCVFPAAPPAEEVLLLTGAGPNQGAVAGAPSDDWTQLLDPTGQVQDMSFLLFTQPLETHEDNVCVSADPDDGSVEIVLPVRKKE
jgi:hypothetical protein